MSTTFSAAPKRQIITGWLLFSLILLSIAHGVSAAVPELLIGVLAWLAGSLLFAQVRGLARLQIFIMLGIGSVGIAWGLFAGSDLHFLQQALLANQSLIAMLLAVSFLRLVTALGTDPNEVLPSGKAALWKNLLGMHVFASVINYSSVMIMGERLARQQPLSPLQAVVLSRGFALAAHWSPFFAAMGIALSHAPGSSLPVLVAVGLPCALLALLYSGWELSRHPDAAQSYFYPMHFQALWMPGLLAILVIVVHYLLPALPILSLVSMLALSLSLLLLLASRKHSGGEFIEHIHNALPKSANETLLFLAAGVFAAGISAMIYALDWQLSLSHFGATEATILLIISVLVSVFGVHPVISIATAGGMLAPLVDDPNLLGITFLMSWALGVLISPYSGIHLAMQGRFKINGLEFLRGNWRFVLLMCLVYGLVLQLYEWTCCAS